MFRPTLMIGRMPSRLRSSGTMQMPLCTASRGERMESGRPFSRTVASDAPR